MDIIWSGHSLDAGREPWQRVPRPDVLLVGTLCTLILFIHVDYVILFIYMYTYICVWRELQQYKINLDFSLVVLWCLDGYDQQF